MNPKGTSSKKATRKKARGSGDKEKEPSPQRFVTDFIKTYRATPFHSTEDEAFISIKRGDCHENWAIEEPDFKKLIAGCFYEEFNFPANTEMLAGIVNIFAARARYNGEKLKVFTRVGELDGIIYLDLCDEKWRVVQIRKNGWNVLSKSPVKFRRCYGMKALPVPSQKGNIHDLKTLINIGSEDDFVLLVSFMVAALRPTGPYCLLLLQGNQGSAKSAFTKIIRELIDPSMTPHRALPRKDDDLIIAANNAWLPCFDNVSKISPEMSDNICRLCTGAGFGNRRLYSNNAETLFNSSRPIILNGIQIVNGRADLLDRSIVLNLPKIEERLTEAEVGNRFAVLQPGLLGALLNGVSQALRRLDSIVIDGDKLPRMADFAKWGAAAEPAFGWREGTFLAAYKRNRYLAGTMPLDDSPLLEPLKELLSAEGKWSGTATELSDELGNYVTVKASRLPKSPGALSAQLQRISTNLALIGINVNFVQTNGDDSKKLINITLVGRGELPKEVSLSRATTHN